MYSYRLPSDEAARVSVATLSPVAYQLAFLGEHDATTINKKSLAAASAFIGNGAYNVITAVSSSFLARMPAYVSSTTIGDKVVITNMAATAARILPASATGEFIAGVASIALNANESAILVRYNASNWIRI